jgi:hypothetical protein
MRLRMREVPSPLSPARNNRHILCVCDHAGRSRLLLHRGKAGTSMTTQAHGTIIDTATHPARTARRADAGTVRLSQPDIDGLLLCGEH